jgi:hypothetical protein
MYHANKHRRAPRPCSTIYKSAACLMMTASAVSPSGSVDPAPTIAGPYINSVTDSGGKGTASSSRIRLRCEYNLVARFDYTIFEVPSSGNSERDSWLGPLALSHLARFRPTSTISVMAHLYKNSSASRFMRVSQGPRKFCQYALYITFTHLQRQ